MQNKSGQVTIYIIIAVIIVVAVVLFLLLRTGLVPNPLGGETKNPNEYLSSCLEDPIANAVAKLGPQGGNINPTLYKNFKFSDEDKPYKVSYLCYNVNNYLPCVNQQPMLVSHVEEEIKKEIQGSAQDCFSGLEKSYRSAGYEVSSSGSDDFSVRLSENTVVITFEKDLKLTKAGESQNLKKVSSGISSDIYSLINVAVEAINREVLSCDFDYVAYIKFYPKFKIAKETTTDGTEIYSIKKRETGELFRFAVRGCVIPPTY